MKMCSIENQNENENQTQIQNQVCLNVFLEPPHRQGHLLNYDLKNKTDNI